MRRRGALCNTQNFLGILGTSSSHFLSLAIYARVRAFRQQLFAQARNWQSTHSMPSTGRKAVGAILLSFLVCCSFRMASGFKDWYFGVDKLEFSSTVPVEGTVSCAFESSTGDVLANLYGFFNISWQITPKGKDIGQLCSAQQGCRWEESHCEASNHVNCSSCQTGMGFDRFYHLCFDPRQIGQSCVFQHQCQQSDRLSLCLQRKCECKARHSKQPEGCWPVVELGYLCGPRTICGTTHAECKDHACRCGKEHKPENGTCTVDVRIEVTDVLVIVMSTMIVFAAFTSLICILLRDKLPEDEDANRSRYSLNSIR
ncbi:uncharacterized protein LOC144151715 isoform X3 [Haemaphysalis longicornis]